MSSEDTKSSDSPKSRRPATRSSSLRQTLNFASVGKAIIAGVGRHSKESSQEDKAAKKATKTSRRSSAIVVAAPPAPSAPRPSIGGESRTASAAAAIKREVTPDNKVVTRRRAAAQAKAKTEDAENMQQKSPNSATPISAIRVSSRTRATNAPSGLPKPRKSATLAAMENVPAEKSATPVRTGTRRRLSESSDEGEKEQQKRTEDRNARPISPLPHRAALKNSNAVNATPPTTPSTPTGSRGKPPSPPANRSSPTRPTKLLKTANNTSAAASVPSAPTSRPSSAQETPRTPKASALKSALTRSAKDRSATSSPLRDAPNRNSPSPLARNNRFGLRPTGSAASSSNTVHMSHISESTDEDSDEDDVVELLLAPVTSPNLAAPTPAMPRIMPKDRRNKSILETPSKNKSSIYKADKSRLQPPLQTQGLLRPQTASLRVPKPQLDGTANSRKSILTWEQLSSDASRTLGEGEADRMIADMPAPFSGPTSPALSALIDIPPSPCLSSIDSPGGFGSISQVLLPDVTPSPAVFAHASARFNVSAEASAESSSTYLRLQLASAEHLSHERLLRIQAMEEEIHNLKAAHSHQMEEVAAQVAHMEREEQRAKFAKTLEQQIWQVKVKGEEAVATARAEVEARSRAERESALKAQSTFCQVSCSAKSAQGSWTSVVDTCQAELQSIHGERQMLALLVSELEALRGMN